MSNHNIQIQSKEPVTIDEQISNDEQIPLKENKLNNRKSSSANETVEKSFLVEQVSLERSSPPAFIDEVNTLNVVENMTYIIKLHKKYIT